MQRELFKRLNNGMFADAPIGILVMEPGGRIFAANQRIERMLGYLPDELEGKPLGLIIPERYRTAHERHEQQFGANPHARPMEAGRELTARRKDGTELPVEVGLGSVQIEGQLMATAFVVDISERKRIA